MVQYNDYEYILFATNFIGGAGQGALPNPGSDDRADINSDSSDIYQFHYMVLASLEDQIAVVKNVTGLTDEAALVASGNLIVA